MASDTVLTLRPGGGRPGSGVGRLHESLLRNPALRTGAQPTLLRAAAEPGTMSGWADAVIGFGPLVLGLPSFVRELKVVLDHWLRLGSGGASVTLTGPRGSVTYTGNLTDAQFQALMGAVLPLEEAAQAAPEESGGATGDEAGDEGAPGAS